MKIAVLTARSGLETGGAERLYEGLVSGLEQIGHDVERIDLPADEGTFEKIVENYSFASNLDLRRFDVVISTKAPTFAIRHPKHVVYLVHTIRVFYDMFGETFPDRTPEQLHQRQVVIDTDNSAFRRATAVFTIGHEVSSRLAKYNHLKAPAIHPPMSHTGFRSGEFGDYLFMPGRLHDWKRVDLAIRAVLTSKLPIKLMIAGTGEAEGELKRLARGDPRIRFLGRVPDSELIDLYSRCFAVPFLPVREDYGYITMEAAASGKPIVTCTDSGEPTQIVADRQTGLVCVPDVNAVRSAFEELFSNREFARELGKRAQHSIRTPSWTDVARDLVNAAMQESPEPQRVTVVDMQPILPAVGGGRLRLKGLYHGLGSRLKTEYVGSYDWPGESARRIAVSPSLVETDVPLAAAHHEAASQLSRAASGKVVIDISMPMLGHLSPDFLSTVIDHIDRSDAVVFSHPWMYPLCDSHLRRHQLVVYDSHNVEGLLRAQLLNEDNPTEAELLRGVVQAEHRLGMRADLVLVCSQDDLRLFCDIYQWPAGKIRVVPNGVMTSEIAPALADQKYAARLNLSFEPEEQIALFIGSNYAPNMEAATFIVNELSTRLPDIRFAIAGGVCEQLPSPKAENVRLAGTLTEEEKGLYLAAADIAINPMFSGSGTNIKMLEFMAAGLPTIATKVGARGINGASSGGFIVAGSSAGEFAEAISSVVSKPELCRSTAQSGRRLAETDYSWERISANLGRLLEDETSRLGIPRPLVTVVTPTYERHDYLEQLLGSLASQSYTDFEWIIVDQSHSSWVVPAGTSLQIRYIHTDLKGAVRARNTGVFHAFGEIIAFTDDDCQPASDWLENMVPYFQTSDVVGVEGRIDSDKYDDPNYRPVTNRGVEGHGFMTANLAVRASAFRYLGGFDMDFDNPHFREDTDFGWRLSEIGKVPFAGDVRVFHPPMPRSDPRESVEQRNRFFEKDALLYQKHPDRYKQLFLRERHFERSRSFWENLARGADRLGVDISELQAIARNEVSEHQNLDKDKT